MGNSRDWRQQRHFHRRVLERFLTPEELEALIEEYHLNAGGRAVHQIKKLRFGLHRTKQKWEVPVRRDVR